METLKLNSKQSPRLLIGHTGLMDLILAPFEGVLKNKIRTALTEYDRLSLEMFDIPNGQKQSLIRVLEARGKSADIIKYLEEQFGNQEVLNNLKRLFEQLEPIAKDQGISLQLDPTFQPHFELYTGLVFQLVCQGSAAPVVIARGGRYDELVERCGAEGDNSAGVGFSFSIDDIRELLTEVLITNEQGDATLVAYSKNSKLETALKVQSKLHKNEKRAFLELDCCVDKQDAQSKMSLRGCNKLHWIEN